MQTLAEIAAPFVELAHRIVWCTVATVDAQSRPRSRVLHPLWSWDGERLTGVIATGPTPVKVANLEASPYVSCNYWSPEQDVATAECRARWCFDDQTCIETWDAFASAPEPVGYDPAIIPPWSDGPTSEAFAVLKLEPWRLRVFPGSVLLGQGGEVLNWRRAG
ncbi:MAG: pyridoxamine 5'-phosphate oxidase family protein [Acidimicrobiia bacterium]|nr:pyridoxamine 5'-phosphate oxidase family protein [Acidimicrobiia bacterium]